MRSSTVSTSVPPPRPSPPNSPANSLPSASPSAPPSPPSPGPASISCRTAPIAAAASSSHAPAPPGAPQASTTPSATENEPRRIVELKASGLPRRLLQVNRFLLPELLGVVAGSRSGESAWDLYAGVGLFTRALAPHFDRITAVEVAEPAFTALASTRMPNRHAVKSTTLDFLQAAVLQRDRPELIVLDPPRTGAGREVCELLARIAAPTLIYVSCSPQTLPADMATLTASGYTIAELHLLDLFPQTTHIETVAILTR